MPWYWSDDLARILIDIHEPAFDQMIARITTPVAIRRDETSIDEAAIALVEEGVISLAA